MLTITTTLLSKNHNTEYEKCTWHITDTAQTEAWVDRKKQAVWKARTETAPVYQYQHQTFPIYQAKWLDTVRRT